MSSKIKREKMCENKLAKLRRCVSHVHFKKNFGKIHPTNFLVELDRFKKFSLLFFATNPINGPRDQPTDRLTGVVARNKTSK